MWEWFLHNGMFFLSELANALQRPSASSSARFYGAAQRSVQKRAQSLHNVNGAGMAPYGPYGAAKLSVCRKWPLVMGVMSPITAYLIFCQSICLEATMLVFKHYHGNLHLIYSVNISYYTFCIHFNQTNL